MDCSATNHGVGQFIAVVDLARRNSSEPWFEVGEHLEQAVFQATFPDATDDALHFFRPASLAELSVNGRVTEQHDSALELGDENQKCGTALRSIEPTFSEQLKCARMCRFLGGSR